VVQHDCVPGVLQSALGHSGCLRSISHFRLGFPLLTHTDHSTLIQYTVHHHCAFLSFMPGRANTVEHRFGEGCSLIVRTLAGFACSPNLPLNRSLHSYSIFKVMVHLNDINVHTMFFLLENYCYSFPLQSKVVLN
jgi:hypothetical protein